jgi:hypothetical protein
MVEINTAEALQALVMEGGVFREKKKGRPYPLKFERHVRALMATGISAELCRQTIILNGKFFLGEEQYKKLDIPNADWFRAQREGVGIESTLLQWMRIARCDEVVQHGYDETNIDCQATFNQWCMIREGDLLSIIVVECGGILTGSTADEIAEHIQITWERGHHMVLALREDIISNVANGQAEADRLVPLTDGGVLMLKIGSTMHDTCNLANAIPRRLRVMKDESGIRHFGGEYWNSRPEADKVPPPPPPLLSHNPIIIFHIVRPHGNPLAIFSLPRSFWISCVETTRAIYPAMPSIVFSTRTWRTTFPKNSRRQ